ETRAQLTADGSPMTSSLYRDLNQGHAVEADQIIGDLIARARASATPTPLLEAVGVALKLYENRRAQA
ncbi:MAG: 2-dehydropantoate 2-reductase, partial [Rhizobiales bacterium 35-66-30]